ncbi:MAG: hypothetical protein GXP25_04275 [Planctomycetes bacterium]|nr:hypothetical protein [Planctomycetota bacterium]
MLQKYLTEQQKNHSYPAREKRKEIMKLRHTEPHYQGVSPPMVRTH